MSNYLEKPYVKTTSFLIEPINDEKSNRKTFLKTPFFEDLYFNNGKSN